MTLRKVVTIVGTRPEVIKMAPVIRELERRAGTFSHSLVTTGQHREMLRQMLSEFGLKPDFDLELMEPGQNLARFGGRALSGLADLFSDLKPAVVLIQGDTTTVTAAALAAFYQGIRVGHVEAGLRSFDRRNPFPEEVNRRIATCATDFHFAPTERARQNLLSEGVDDAAIFVTGNTIVDALGAIHVTKEFDDKHLERVDFAGRRVLLVTAHRRESFGEPLRSICLALAEIVRRFADVEVVYPVHLNPEVSRVVNDELAVLERVHLVAPVTYGDLLRLLSHCYFVLTDSGGIQEEAPSFRKPVLVLRDLTERPELIEANAGLIVGTNRDRIVEEAARLLQDRAALTAMCPEKNPFGDGRAAQRIVDALETEPSLG
jgi:UDP-N-acetylglucosamine 2-epimerase (non-hydrolysing)